MTAASILVSAPDHFTVQRFDGDLEEMQELVGGYVEAIVSPDKDWHLYCDEEGTLKGSTINIVSSVLLHRFALIYQFTLQPPRLFGNIVWLGPVVTIGNEDGSAEHSTPIGVVEQFVDIALRHTYSDTPIVVVRHHNDIWVYDKAVQAIPRIMEIVEAARFALAADGEHGIIEVWPNISPTRWIELRVEIMDDFRITLHDKREDRSYG